MLWAPEKSPIAEGDLPEMAAVERARGGSLFTHQIQLIGDTPYQVSAVPIKRLMPGLDPAERDSEDITAVLLIGVRLQRYYEEWSEQSDEDPGTRMKPMLVDGLKVYASAWPRERDGEFARALQPEKHLRIRVGD